MPYEVYFGDSLVIDGEKMAETTQNYDDHIKALVEVGGVVNNVRREIFEKMNCSTELFTFADDSKAKDNFDMRQETVAIASNFAGNDIGYFNSYNNPPTYPRAGDTFFDETGHEAFVDANGNGVYDTPETYTDSDLSGTYTPGEPFSDRNNDGTWTNGEAYTDTNTNGKYDYGSWSIGSHWKPSDGSNRLCWDFLQKAGTTPFGSICNVTPFRGECAGALQIAVLKGAANTLGAVRFNAIHTSLRLGIWDPNEVDTHFGVVTDTETFVPGDYVYMNNKDDYGLWAGEDGFWSGENCIYIGQDATGTPKFTGMGLEGKSEKDLRDEVASNYDNDCKAESYTDNDHSGTYTLGEPFYDRNENGTWDDAHTIADRNSEVRFTSRKRLVTGE